jgi:osmotically inducible protein OsmC
MQILYKAAATASGGREGRAVSSDGNLDVQLTIPKELGGPGADGTTNPEQLFAAGYAACFHSALKLIAKKAGTPVDESTVTAHVGIGTVETDGFGLAVELVVALPGVDPAEGEALVAQAHEVCPYSNATRNNIDVKLTVTSQT